MPGELIPGSGQPVDQPLLADQPPLGGQPHLAALVVYPVKGCAGMTVTRWPLSAQGLAGDREWMIADARGQFLSQREYPSLALVRADLDDDWLTLNRPGASALRVPRQSPRNGEATGGLAEVRIWSDRVLARDEGPAAAAWLSDFLGQPARLVHFARPDQRPCDPSLAAGASVKFADAFPLLVLSRASVVDLGRRLGAPDLAWQRFRPNLLIDGVAAYEEDQIDTMECRSVALRLVKPCTRCSVPAIDPQTGRVTSVDPLAALLGYRFDARWQGATLGMNAVIDRGESLTISVGDTLQIGHRWADN